MKSLRYEHFKETIYYKQLNNGLEVFVLPKPGFHKTFATCSTPYGSIHRSFSVSENDRTLHYPAGIAHFLEHKMFDNPGENVFHSFAKQGAFVNGFTNFTRTSYTLSATSNIHDNLSMLLNFVQTPYFTDESVEKEKLIIAQEIKMHHNNPEWRARFEILKNMYKYHPVNTDIVGTVSSIQQITKEDLYDCYHAFYHPSNMILFVIGSVIPEATFQHIADQQQRKVFRDKQPIAHFFPNETQDVYRGFNTIKLPVRIPKVFIGYKEADTTKQGEALFKYELCVKLLLELMFGKSSEAYHTMYRSGIIDDSFAFDYTQELGFGFSMLGGNSESPEKVADEVERVIHTFKQTKRTKEDVQRVRNKKKGEFLSALNSLPFVANQFTKYRFNHIDLFDLLPTLDHVTEEDLEEVLHSHFVTGGRTVCIIEK